MQKLDVIIHDVQYVKQMNVNSIFIRKLQKIIILAISSNNYCFRQANENSRLLLKVNSKDNTFKVTATKEHGEGRAFLSVKNSGMGPRHARLGHVTPRLLKMIVKNSVVLELPPDLFD